MRAQRFAKLKRVADSLTHLLTLGARECGRISGTRCVTPVPFGGMGTSQTEKIAEPVSSVRYYYHHHHRHQHHNDDGDVYGMLLMIICPP